MSLQAMINEAGFIQAISAARFARYESWAQGDIKRAFELYRLNCALAEAFYTPLHILEIILRNRIHDVASTLPIGDPSLAWFDRPEFQLRPRQPEQLNKARRELSRHNKKASPNYMIAALTFGYWTTFLGPDYENLWQKGLHKIARNHNSKGLRRKELSEPLFKLRYLRNRIAHHEPIIHWDLDAHHHDLMTLVSYLSPHAALWLQANSRFLVVYPRGGISLCVARSP
jgi:Abi-like protein